MKTTYERTRMTVTEFASEDVIVTSNPVINPTDAPPVGAGGDPGSNQTIVL